MKVALCGATGRAGSRILNELLMRSHHVVALVREAGTLPPREGVTVAIDDLSDLERTAQLVEGTEALISAYAPPQSDPNELANVTKRLIDAVARSGVPRFLMVGGAGSLEVSPGLALSDSGKLPAEWLPIASAHARALAILRSSLIDWTSLCPAIYFDPGDRTGKFRLGTDNLIVAADPKFHFHTEREAQQHCPNDTVVWVNTQTGIYHLKGERWYGATKQGAYECRREADAEGDRLTRNGQ